MLEQSKEAVLAKPKRGLARFMPLALLASAIALAYGFGLHEYLSFEQLAANREAITDFVANHYLLAALGFFLVYGLVVALSLPVASFLTIFGGLIFGPLLGGLLTVLAATVGALSVFMVARTSFGETLARRAGPVAERLRDGFKDHALNYMLFLRLVPLFPFWLVNIAPALLGVSTSTYLLGTFLGIIPATFAFSYVGAGLGSIIEAQGSAYEACIAKASAAGVAPNCHVSLKPGDLVTTELLIALAAMGVVALIPVVLKKFRKS